MDPETLKHVVVGLIVLVLSVTVHEFGHAFVADYLGDDLPRRQGRVTLNPVAHADPIGTIALPVLAMLISGGLGFGWGRPVMVNPIAMTRKLRMRTAHMFVALAGPVMNVLFGLFISIVALVLVKAHVVDPYAPPTVGGMNLYTSMLFAVELNFVLAIFNMLPAPPLDGGTVLQGLLPDSLQPAYKEVAPYGIFVFMAVIAIPQLNSLFVWPASHMFDAWTRLIGLP